MTQKKETQILILSLIITVTILGVGQWSFTRGKEVNTTTNDSPKPTQTINNQSTVSIGSEFLIVEDDIPFV